MLHVKKITIIVLLTSYCGMLPMIVSVILIFAAATLAAASMRAATDDCISDFDFCRCAERLS